MDLRRAYSGQKGARKKKCNRTNNFLQKLQAFPQGHGLVAKNVSVSLLSLATAFCRRSQSNRRVPMQPQVHQASNDVAKTKMSSANLRSTEGPPPSSKSTPGCSHTHSPSTKSPLQHRTKQPRAQHASLSHCTVNVKFTALCSVCEYFSTLFVLKHFQNRK